MIGDVYNYFVCINVEVDNIDIIFYIVDVVVFVFVRDNLNNNEGI